MKLKLVILILFVFSISSFAQIIVKKPVRKSPTSFAIIIDKTTYDKTSDAVDAYKNAIENDGLATYVLINDWKNPDEIKSEILKLYKSKNPLEGIVLIGDVPIPMVRKAQHMTSAFKIDENQPMFVSSIPTDRFYDDLDLKFNFIKQDSSHKLCFYYTLSPDSPQRVEKDIYSGRIKASIDDNSKYEVIKNYLLRVVQQKKQQNQLTNMMVFTGHGYNSEALTAWTDEHLALREQFPHLFTPGHTLKHLNFRMSDQMKEVVLSELQDPKLDIAIFHAHGEDDTQYLVDLPNPKSPDGKIESVKLYLRSKLRTAKRRKQSVDEAKAYFMKSYNVPESWFEGAFSDSVIKADSILENTLDIHADDARKIASQPKLMIFDECFNGSFHESPFIAGEYVLGKGNTIAGIANTTNALQDQWIDELIGLLKYGLRLGQWHKFNNLMESHLIGDPTFHFSSVDGLDLKNLISSHQKDLAYWKKMLQSSDDIPLRSLSIAMLYKNLGQKYEKDLVDIYRKDPSFNIRMQCMKYIAEINSPVFRQILKESILDPYELVRRISADWMGKSGLKEYLPIMAKRMLTDESDRVSYNLKSTMVFIDPVAAYEECVKALDQMPSNANKDKLKETLKSSILRNKEWLEKELIPGITSDTLKLKKRISNVRTFRNYNFEQAIPVLISLAKNQKEDKDLRVSVLEALGWYALSANKGIIAQACEEIIKDSSNPKEVIDEATKTKNRIKEGYSNLITS